LDTFISYLPALLCGAMLLFICIPMMRNMHKGHGESDDAAIRQEVAELREELARLRAERTLAAPEETRDG
jgi:hypothetical protein